jgi:hypothetical protein
MRVLYIITIVFAFLFIIIMAAGTAGTNEERDRYYRYQMDGDDFGYYDSTPQYVESTYIAVGISIPYFLFMITLCILGLVYVKTATNKVFSIIGLSLTGIMLVWGLVVLSSPRSMSFDEVGGGWILYGVFTLVLAIIGTVQAFRAHRNLYRNKAGRPNNRGMRANRPTVNPVIRRNNPMASPVIRRSNSHLIRSNPAIRHNNSRLIRSNPAIRHNKANRAIRRHRLRAKHLGRADDKLALQIRGGSSRAASFAFCKYSQGLLAVNENYITAS